MPYQFIFVESRGKVGLITLNRPEALNALSLELRGELKEALDRLETDPSIGAIVITGNEKAFAAGADIKAMLGWSFIDIINSEQVTVAWERLGALWSTGHCCGGRLRARWLAASWR